MSAPTGTLPHIKLVFERDKTVDDILSVWKELSDEELKVVDPSSGSSLLFFAAQRKPDSEACALGRYLVNDRQVCSPSLIDANQQTALYFAARDGNPGMCSFLLEAGCDVKHRDTAGQTALFYAAREGHSEVIQLIEHFAISRNDSIVNATDKVGQSALFYAAREGKRETCEVLLALGADPSIRDWQKKCAHTYASRRGHATVGALLKAKSAEARKSASSDEERHKVLLQYHMRTGDGTSAEWIFPKSDIIEEFEKKFPDMAAWSHIHTPIYQPSDAFRIEWSQICLDIINVISNFRDAVWFAKPVDIKALHCPDYYDIVKEPRDLSMIRKKLKELGYDDLKTFQHDMSLIWTNCFKYNPATSPVHKAGERLKELFEKAWAEKHLDEFIKRESRLMETLAR